jgi:putative ABC transport system permease protein
LYGFRDPVGQNLRINGRQFTVIGVLKSKGGTALGNLDNQVLVPITTVYYRLNSNRTTSGDIAIQTINAQIRNLDEIETAVQEIATLLRLRHRLSGDDDFTISSQQETIETLEDTQETFVIFLAAIAGISLLVGGIGIMNIMMVSVTERTREIGIRKAMGAKRRDILYQFVSEATLLSLGGGIMGAVIGVTLSNVIDGQNFGGQTFNTAVSSDITLLAVTVAAAIGLFFGIYPAARAAALHPIEALRYE